jgi:SAM-dependent methyltransferase
MKCRHCKNILENRFLDLGFAPPSNAYLIEDALNFPEKYYPLKVYVCNTCWLVQTDDHAEAWELFSPDYAYFSSTSSGWLAHAKRYTEVMIERLGLNEGSHVIEVASNDGYLLKNFLAAGIPCLGIEPTASTAAAAEKLQIPVLREFFSEELGKKLAIKGKQADLIIGNNVYAHVPDINDFTLGMKALLKPGGTITLEFPHLMELIEHTQFDTVYHEHFSYLSFHTARCIFEAAGLRIWDVEQILTHGGSLRVFGCHAEDVRQSTPQVEELYAKEVRRGLLCLDIYKKFQVKANRLKDDLLNFLIEKKRAGKKVAAYGAAAKGNTLLNYAGVKTDLLPFVCDAASAKQGKYLPGSHIPILPPSALVEFNPDFVVILPWNIAEEVTSQLKKLVTKNTKFVTAVPKLQIK